MHKKAPMDKTGKNIIMSALSMTLLTGCSGVVSHGFDDESALYSKPASEKEINKAEEVQESPEKAVPLAEEMPESDAAAEPTDEDEGETKTSYDRDVGE